MSDFFFFLFVLDQQQIRHYFTTVCDYSFIHITYPIWSWVHFLFVVATLSQIKKKEENLHNTSGYIKLILPTMATFFRMYEESLIYVCDIINMHAWERSSTSACLQILLMWSIQVNDVADVTWSLCERRKKNDQRSLVSSMVILHHT